MKDASLRSLSLHEKLASFYCVYVREEPLDRELDGDSVRCWEKIGSSRRKACERVSMLLQQIENTSAAHVRHLDNTFRAKRELVLLAEGTIAGAISTSPSAVSTPPATVRRGSGATSSSATPASSALKQVDAARSNNELLQECGALPVFTQQLLSSIHALRTLDFARVDVDKVDTLIRELQQDIVLLYLLILFNTGTTSTCERAVFDRELVQLGVSAPTFALVTLLDCLAQLNVVPGFPIKRLLLLAYEWLCTVLGDVDTLATLKRARRARHAPDDAATARLADDDANGLLQCKTFKPFYESPATLDPQDPYFLQKKKFVALREAIHTKYRHRLHHELTSATSSAEALATAPLASLDDEWEARCEVVYQLFLPRSRDFASLLSNLITISCGSALLARDKKTFLSRRPPPSSDNQSTINDFGGGDNATTTDNLFWRWILREKAIVLDVATLVLLLVFKHFRASHVYKGEYFMQFFLEANVLATLTKFMNKDIQTYLHVSRQEPLDDGGMRLGIGGSNSPAAPSTAGAMGVAVGFVGLEKEIERLHNIRIDDDVLHEYAVQSTRTLTTILRILQKLTKRKPNIIKNALCRSASIVWLKRVVSLKIPLPRLYALKLVKSQAKYLGHGWMRKFTCVGLLTDVYLYVRPELDDDWLRYEDDDMSKPPQSSALSMAPSSAVSSSSSASSQDSVERIVFGEMQAFHHKYYWSDAIASKKSLPSGVSMICEAQTELARSSFDVDGGRVAKFYNDLKLDSVNFCQHYDKWLDQEGLTLDPLAASTALPIAFG